jgi:phospholipase/lecithinase/hemolysin
MQTTLVFLDLRNMESEAKEGDIVEQLEGNCLKTNFPDEKQNLTTNVEPGKLDTCNDHFFYDLIHPTEPVHKFFSQQIASAFSDPIRNKFTVDVMSSANAAAAKKVEFVSILAVLLSFAVMMATL